ncbi:hypothetical protein NP233_g9600 [Leucocoprinus birnbaumii]|uniref:Uncharacterized protein n=1 Tax=Leucocoprinus birnbaumii TaxID=56174 RepID=A0AAD5VQM8_9AGAR|nr:hypothetical protein NP233_g9600 [Leucocoprinus birnbaumii]
MKDARVYIEIPETPPHVQHLKRSLRSPSPTHAPRVKKSRTQPKDAKVSLSCCSLLGVSRYASNGLVVPRDYIHEDNLLAEETDALEDGNVSDSLPILLLEDVSVFERSLDELVPLSRLLELRPEYPMQAPELYATGYSKHWLVAGFGDSDDEGHHEVHDDFRIASDDEDDEEDRLSLRNGDELESASTATKTSTILEVMFYHYPETKRMDRNLYIRTQKAWYMHCISQFRQLWMIFG